MKKNLYLILIFILVNSCKKNEKWYSEKQICECYSSSHLDILSNFDNKLNNCLTDFNSGLNTKNLNIKKENLKEFAAKIGFALTKNLIKNCPNYQKDFNEIVLSKYSKSDTNNLNTKIDSIKLKLKTDKNNSTELIKLAEYRVLNSELDSALNLVNQVIKINSKSEGGYFVRSFIYHKKGLINKSIEDYKKLKKITKNSERKKWSELMIINLQQQLK